MQNGFWSLRLPKGCAVLRLRVGDDPSWVKDDPEEVKCGPEGVFDDPDLFSEAVVDELAVLDGSVLLLDSEVPG